MVLLLLLVFPFVFNIWVSLTGWQINQGDWWKAPWIGLDNYQDALTDSRLWGSLLRTSLVTLVCVLVEGGIGLVLALCFAEKFRGRALLMGVTIVPMMILPVVNGFIFFMLFQSDGPVNDILRTDKAWLNDPWSALFVVALSDIYQWTPLMFLIMLAGYNAVPPNLRSAATVLGASRWQEFRYVVLPLMRPVIVIALIIRAIEAFKLFDPVFILTGGGPGTSTETISVYLYKVAFNDFRLGYAAALALVVLILLSIVGMRAVEQVEGRVKSQKEETVDE
ncbi:sugar ABC transporter permease [Nocardioides endophyticus]|uniref:carbohydrate ABC transporter permease n=1 Tax=Nocardioides endophyticus TaxID=1353775 RepID=UPI0031E6FDC5